MLQEQKRTAQRTMASLHTFSKLEFVKDRCLTSCIKPDHQDAHLLLAELKTLKEQSHRKKGAYPMDSRHCRTSRPPINGKK